MFVVAFSEEMGEVLGVELAEPLTIIDGLAHDEHRGEGEVVVVDNLRKVFEDSSINLLVRPRQMIAGSNGGVFWVLLKQFALHIINNRCSAATCRPTCRRHYSGLADWPARQSPALGRFSCSLRPPCPTLH